MSETWFLKSAPSKLPGWIRGIAVDAQDNLYCTVGESVWKLNTKDPNIEPQRIIHQDGATLRSVVWNGVNKLYICDWSRHSVLQYNLNTGRLSVLAGTGKEGDKDGNIKEATFCYPRGIALDRNGNLYVSDYHHIRKIDLNRNTVETIAGCTTGRLGAFKDGECRQAKFDVPGALVVADDGTIYVADVHGQCIRKIKDGIVSTIAGTPGKGGFRDGTLREAKLKYPRSLILSSDGSLLVVDNTALRKVDITRNWVSSIQTNCNCFCIAADQKSVFLGTVEGHVLKLDNTWKTERYLWIGNLKEDPSYCNLARLPTEIVKEITTHLVS